MPALAARRVVARARAAWRRPAVRTAIRLVVAIVVVGLVVWLVLVPQFRAGEGDMRRLLDASPPLIAGAAVVQAASLTTFSVLTRSILGPGIRFPRLVAIDLADLAVNHTLPGGGATAAAFRFRLLRDDGVSAQRAMTVATVETVVSNTALGIVFLAGVLGSLGRISASPLVWIAGGATAATALAGILLLWSLPRRRVRWTAAAARWDRRLRFRRPRLQLLVREAADTVAALAQDRRRATLAVGAALGNWLLDALCLWLVLAAFGSLADPAAVLLAYGLAQVLAQVPLTPGGIGLVEGAATLTLAGSGLPHGVALLGVLSWRVLEFWLPVPLGWGCYLVLRATSASLSRRRAASSSATTASSPTSPKSR